MVYYYTHFVIQWDKVQTLDDMKRLIAAMEITFGPNHPMLGSILDLVKEEPKTPPQAQTALYCGDIR